MAKYTPTTTRYDVAMDVGHFPGTLGSNPLDASARTALKYYSRRFLKMSREDVQGPQEAMRTKYDSDEAQAKFLRDLPLYHNLSQSQRDDIAKAYLSRGWRKNDATGEWSKAGSPEPVIGTPMQELDTPKQEKDMKQKNQPEMQTDDGLKKLREIILGGAVPTGGTVDEAAVTKIIEARLKEFVNPRITIQIKDGDKLVREIEGLQHKLQAKLIKYLSTVDASGRYLNIMLVGGAGGGKTTAAEKAAEIFGVDFQFNGALDTPYKLSGFIDAQGRVISTAFRRAYENGGVYLFDEVDASLPGALLAFNAALANGYYDFPDGMVKRHPEFRCIAAANTFGKGADRRYVGRNRLDGASLDRFVFIEWEYDEALELALSSNDKWTKHVQKVRSVVDKLKLDHVVSPRASMFGGALLDNGEAWPEVEDAVLYKGLDSATIAKVRAAL